MACFSGPEIVNDGLVFAYDMDNSQKSWKGEPTTNLFSTFSATENNAVLVGVSPISLACGGSANWSRCNYGGGTFFFNHIETVNPYGLKSLVGNLTATVTGGDYRATISNIGASTLNRTFTFSVWVKNNGGLSTGISMSIRTNGDANGPTVSKAISNDWQRLSITHTFTGTCTNEIRCYLFGINAGRNILLYQALLEEKSFATSFVNGSRSNTEAILDLTNNNTITANSLVYSNDGTFSFNGSHFLDISNAGLINASAFTVDCFVKSPSISNINKTILGVGNGSSNGFWFFKHRSGLGNKLVFHGQDGVNPRIDVISADATPDNVTFHATITFDGTNYQLYMNGAANGSAITNNAIVSSDTIYIGRLGSGSYFEGNIHQLRIYNRALSAAEVAQNFEAFRYRYEI